MNQHRRGINKNEDLEVQPSLIYPPWEPRTHLVEQLPRSQGGEDQGLRQYCLQKARRVPCWSKFQVKSTPLEPTTWALL